MLRHKQNDAGDILMNNQRPEIGKEYPPPDEDQAFTAILATLRGQFDQAFPPGSAGPARRDQHPKAHGCVHARFSVLGSLPPEMRQGLFREEKSYDAWIRFSSSSPSMNSDARRDAHGMAIKLLGVPGEKVLEDERFAETQDFVLANNNAFFVRSASDYVGFIKAFRDNRLLSFFFRGSPFHWRLHELFNMLAATQKRVANPLQIRYWSQTPYQSGPVAVKYSARPLDSAVDPMPSIQGPTFLREAMARTLQDRDVTFDFQVQVQTDPVRMPVEDATIVWNESRSPFYTVARILIPRQEFDTPERDAFAESLSYTPWHSLPEHRPLGTMNRIRRRVYEMISRLRHEANGVPREEPRSF